MPDPLGQRPRYGPASALAVLLVSAAVIALELGLMRCLSVASWHHFAYLVISTALLGFGASGTLLTFVGDRLRARFVPWCAVLSGLFALSAVLCFAAAQALPLEARYVLYSLRHAALMFAYHLLLLVPFLLGALVIGLSLMHFEGEAHRVYATNLAGSALGSVGAVGLMFLLPAQGLLHAVAALGLLAGGAWVVSGRFRRDAVAAGLLTVAVAVPALALLAPLRLEVDQFKALATMRLWEREGRAEHVLTRHGPRARLDVYESPAQHHALFVGLGATELPPPQLSVLADGETAATVLRIASAKEAAILDATLMAVPYELLRASEAGRGPAVLLLGEAGGVNVWLARRMGARHVTVVQPNPQLVDLMQGPLAHMAGRVLSGRDVTVVVAAPRVFLERTDEEFDLIQVVTSEAQAAGASGLRSLHEDFLLTREGMALCLDALTERGAVAATRGRQLPPRDNVRLLATMAAGLEASGVGEPADHIVQVRDYQAATTLAFRSPVSEATCAALRRSADRRGLDVEWAACAGVRHDRQLHQVAGPEDEPYSYFHYAAREVLTGRREEFFRDWLYDVRPATDDRPYFYSFFRWKSLPRFIEAYGEQWLRRTELAYVVLVFVLAEVVVVGGVLILLPLLRLRGGGAAPGGRAATGAYFLLLGLAYLMLEMACLMKFTHFLGDPLYSAALVISAFLLFSGLGSALSRRAGRSPGAVARTAAVGIALLSLLYVPGLDAAFGALIGWPLWGRAAAAVAFIAPLAFLMGWPFPGGLTLLQRGGASLVPWAWGANGFASVAAAPLAVMIALAAGYSSVLLICAGLYALAGAVSFALPGQGSQAAEQASPRTART
jgi:hypothetical protein